MDTPLKRLWDKMKERGWDACYLRNSDFHCSEYPCAHFEAHRYLTGFTGTDATLVVEPEKASLWVDGRYYGQAEQEIAGSGACLYKDGMPGVISAEEYIRCRLPEGCRMAAEGRTLSAGEGKKLEELLKERGGSLLWQEDPLEGIWESRPPLPGGAGWLLDAEYAGRAMGEKLEELRRDMKELGASRHLLADLTDIGWLFNLRGSDIQNCPLLMCFALIEEGRALLFAEEGKIQGALRAELEKNGVEIRPYASVYETARALPEGEPVLYSPAACNYALEQALAGKTCIRKPNPVVFRRIYKNETEIRNLRQANREDGAAYVRALHRLLTAPDLTAYTESRMAEELVREMGARPGSLGESFETIVAYQENAANMHYAPAPGRDKALGPEGFLLMDFGSHSLLGTTDQTRTVALGPVPRPWKEKYTLVLKAMLSLMDLVFPGDTEGFLLDAIPRRILWEQGADYRCATGHGVGYLLSVHESPVVMRHRLRPEDPRVCYKAGILVTDEPGYYEEGAYGIRLENDLLAVPETENQYGEFFRFEAVTMAPIDTAPLLVSLLTEEEREKLNRYQKAVYESLAPLLSQEERAWLKEYTKPLTENEEN